MFLVSFKEKKNKWLKICVDDTSSEYACVLYFTWDALGCSGTRLDGVSASTWKCEVGGGPMGVGRLSESTW